MSVATASALPYRIPKPALSRFEIAFGIVLPVICLALDPFIIGINKVAPLALWCVAGLGIFALLLSAFKMPNTADNIIVGILASSAVVAGLIGIILLPLTLMTIFFGLTLLPTNGIGFICVALLGFVPFLTAAAICNRTGAVHAQVQNHSKVLIVLGALLALGVPLAAQGAEIFWFDRQFAAIEGQDTEIRLNAVRALAAYPLMQDRVKRRACGIKISRERNNQPTIPELDMVIGPEGNFKCLQLRD